MFWRTVGDNLRSLEQMANRYGGQIACLIIVAVMVFYACAKSGAGVP